MSFCNRYLAQLVDLENIYLEPSALAGFRGIKLVEKDVEYLKKLGIKNTKDITHIVWATGGNMVPKDIMDEYYNKGKSLLK